MQTVDILAALTEIFEDVFGDPNIVLTPQTTADDIPGWDSMTHIALVVAVEQRFRMKFKTAEIEELKNLGGLIRLISTRAGR